MSVVVIGQNIKSVSRIDGIPQTWKCSSKCKPLTDKEIGVILDFKSGFGAGMKDVLKLLDKCVPIPITKKWFIFMMNAPK